MLRRQSRVIEQFERLVDNLVILLSFLLSYYGRDSLLMWAETFNWPISTSGKSLAPLSEYSIVLIVALFLYNGFLTFLGAYNRFQTSSNRRILRIALFASVLSFVGIAAVLFITKADLSRAVIGLFCMLSALSIAAGRYVLKHFLSYWLRRRLHLRNVLICGVGEQAEKLASMILSQPDLGIGVLGFALLGDPPTEEEQGKRSYKFIAALAANLPAGLVFGNWALEGRLKSDPVDEVIFTDITRSLSDVEEMLGICSDLGVRTTIAADIFSIGMARSELSYFGSLPLIHYQPPPGDKWELVLKRGFDLAASLLALTVFSPVFLLIAALIKITSPGPVLFKQKRVGLNGRIFSLYKFRSMHLDAEDKQDELLDKNEMKGPAFQIKCDPRVTPLGRFLRRFSLDELPQLWNVLRGDMSLVGPRPPVPNEVFQYRRQYRRRLSMRPGLTCTWQVSGRNEISDFDSWMKLDLDYIDNWSLSRDLGILIRTVPAVLFGVGAR